MLPPDIPFLSDLYDRMAAFVTNVVRSVGDVLGTTAGSAKRDTLKDNHGSPPSATDACNFGLLYKTMFILFTPI